MTLSHIEDRAAAHYPQGVPRDVDIPECPFTTIFERAVAAHPDRVATWFQGSKTTYSQLKRRADKAAATFRRLGIHAGDRVSIALPNCPAHVVAFIGALRIGAVVVENNPLYTDDELVHHVTDSGSRLVIAWQPTAVRLAAALKAAGSDARVIAVDVSKDLPFAKQVLLRLPIPAAREKREQLTAPVPKGIPDWHTLVAHTPPLPADHPLPKPDDPALILYTGGTTGAPKGAVASHRNLLANPPMGAAWTGLSLNDEEAPVFYAVLPLFHAYGLTLCLTFGIWVGATIVLFPKFSAREFISTQAKLPATFLAAVPPMLDRIVTAVKAGARVDFSSLKHVISGAMPLHKSSQEAWEDLTGGYVIEGYGMTECTPIIAGNPFTDQRRPGWLGLPFPSTRVRVTSEDDPTVEVKLGERGELQTAGPQVFQGYWDRPEETAAMFVEDADGTRWLRTGDVVVEDEVGFLKMVDRIKEIIITGGFNVYPSQVENVLRGMPGVGDVAVVGVQGEGDLGETVVAAIVPAKEPRKTFNIGPIVMAVPDLPHVNLPKLDLSKLDLAKVDWSKIDLSRFDLSKVDLSKIDLPKIDMARIERAIHNARFGTRDEADASAEEPPASEQASAGPASAEQASAEPTEPTADLSLKAVRAFCEGKLAHYAIPRDVIIVDDLPRSQLGKVVRRQVRDRYLAGDFTRAAE